MKASGLTRWFARRRCAIGRQRIWLSFLLVSLAWSAAQPSWSITIDVRPMCDLTGGCGAGDFFFDYPEALETLRFAVRAFEPFSDNLHAIPSSPGWQATFVNPVSGTNYVLDDLSVPADTLILFAGGRNFEDQNPLAVNRVAEAGPGLANISLSRGQGNIVGPLAADFATWGGSIAFDTLDNGNPRNWHFDVHSAPGPGQTDFLTIALHELAHVLGFGTAPSFDNLRSGNQFLGATTINLNGSSVSLTADGDHWVNGTTSPPYADPPLSALTASLVLGKRRNFTPLDYAALADIGWQVPAKLLGLHGDMNEDGVVDGHDFLAWQRSYGNTGAGSPGDADGSLLVDEFDLWMWRSNHGSRLAVIQALGQVPEPSSLLAFSTAAILVSVMRLKARRDSSY